MNVTFSHNATFSKFGKRKMELKKLEMRSEVLMNLMGEFSNKILSQLGKNNGRIEIHYVFTSRIKKLIKPRDKKVQYRYVYLRDIII